MFIDLFEKIINAVRPKKKDVCDNSSEPASNVTEPWSQGEQCGQESPETQESGVMNQQD